MLQVFLLLKRRLTDELTGFVGSFDDVSVLPTPRLITGETERHDGQHQDDKEANDGEDVGPAHLTLPDVVVAHIVAANTTDVHVVPAGREDHTTEKHQNA